MSQILTFFRWIGSHKYIFTLLVFAVWITFFDQNSLLFRFANHREAARLRSEIEHYREDYERNTELLEELDTDSDALERVAREKFFMKKPNEDIYVFEGDIE